MEDAPIRSSEDRVGLTPFQRTATSSIVGLSGLGDALRRERDQPSSDGDGGEEASVGRGRTIRFSESRDPSRMFAAGCLVGTEIHQRRIVISCVLRLPTVSVASTLTVTTLRFGRGWLNFRFGAVVASVKCSLLLMKTLTVASSVSSVTVMGRD